MALSWEMISFSGLTVILASVIYYLMAKKRPKSLVGQHVVITGGSKGIGLCLAVECAMKGAHVTVIARDEKLLKGAVALMEVIRQYPEQKFQYRCLDISSSYEEIERVLSDVESALGDIYMLINCAGFAICGVYEEVSVADVRSLMDVNYFGSYNCTRYVLPKMKKARRGIIIFTASQAALFGIYGLGPYVASKMAVRGMAESISMETRHLGISVTLALPSDTNTPGFENEQKSKPRETKIICSGGGLAQPEHVAKKILNDALTENFISICGAESWGLTLLCGGMFRWGGPIQNLLHACVLGPMRLVGCFLHLHCERVIKNCAKEKDN